MSEKKEKKKKFNFYWIYAILGVFILGNLLFNTLGTGSKNLNYDQFKEVAAYHFVEKVVIVNKSFGEVQLKPEKVDSFNIVFGEKFDFKISESNYPGLGSKADFEFKNPSWMGDSFGEELQALKATSNFTVDSEDRVNYFSSIVSWILPIAIIVLIWIFLMKRMSGGAGGGGGQIFNIGKSKAKVFEKGKGTNITFKDVAGLEGAKEEVQEIVDFLKNPKKYTELGAKIPKGALLVGPPGTGKTLLAKAVAGEADVPFFSLSGSDFVEMFVGVGASRVRDLFKQAKEKAPAIIFIDEIDAIGRARGKNANFGSNDERENTLNQLLTEMDGFGTNSGVIILAATNRVDILDSALMRAGRFDRQIHADMPDVNERKEIFQVHLKPLKLDKEMDVDFLSKQTPGFSGADIANLCNEAALIAARKKKTSVEKQDFLDAVDRIVGGLEKKNKIITLDERKAIAYHEAGHATIGWLLEHAHPLVKVTIVPRGQSLGAAWYLPEERQITRTNQILHDMQAALGGRAAEQVIFGEISTGALSDLEKVTKQAYAMVSIYGLNERVGNISFYDSSGQEGFNKPYSDETAKIIDEEVKKIVEEQYQLAIKLLTANKDKLTQLAEMLLEREVIFKEDLISIFGERPWKTKEEKIADETEIKIKLPNSDIFEPKDVKMDNEIDKTPVDVAPEKDSSPEVKTDSKDDKSVDF
jgi:cell division protease FtsH